jgi:hypothetical protein
MRMGQRRPVLLTVDDHRAIHEVYALAFEKDYSTAWRFPSGRSRCNPD